MGAFSLATRYAKSLIQLAEEKGQLEAVYKDMKDMNNTFQNSRELLLMFKSPIITTDKKLNVVKLLFEGKVNTLLYQFMILVIKKGREAYFKDIAASFVTQYNVIKNITPVKITSAVKLDAALVQNIIASLKAKEKLGEIELHEVIDASMIGGFTLQYADKMLDSSVSAGLTAMKEVIEDDSYIRKYY